MQPRISLLVFLHSLLTLYHVQSTDLLKACHTTYPSLKTFILKARLTTIQKRFSVFSRILNVSENDLDRILKGDSRPIQNLLRDAKLVTTPSQYQALQKQISQDQTILAKQNLKAVAGKSSIPLNRARLYHFVLASTRAHNLTYDEICDQMDFTPQEFKERVLKAEKADAINVMRQLPFILKVPLTEFTQILEENSLKPSLKLLEHVNRSVHDRQTLLKYVEVLLLLMPFPKDHIFKALNMSESKIKQLLTTGSGNQIAHFFSNLAVITKLPNEQLQAALARANVNSAQHSYLARMHFVIKYDSSPINYVENKKAHYYDRKRIHDGLNQIHRKLYAENHHRKSRINLKIGIWKVISGWSFVFNFKAPEFMQDNFKHADIHDPHPVAVKQGNQYLLVQHDSDWLPILRKLHLQLKAIRSAFNLTAVQNGPYSKYVHIKHLGNLKHPKAHDFRKGLAELKTGRYTFTAHFVRTGIKAIPRGKEKAKEYYVPMLMLKDIKHDQQLVAKQVWFNYGQSFVKLGQLQPGDLIRFKARIHQYHSGMITKNKVATINYELNYPSDIKLARRIHVRDMVPMPTDRATLTGYAIEHNHAAAYDFSLGNYRYAHACSVKYLNWRKAQQEKEI